MPQYVYEMNNVLRNGAPGNGFESTIEAPNAKEALRQLKREALSRKKLSNQNPAFVRTELYAPGAGSYVRDTDDKDW